MKVLLTVLSLAVAYSSAKKLQVSLPAESIVKMMEALPSCIEESDVSPDIMLQIKEKRQTQDESFQKFSYCMVKKLGLGNKKGTLKPEKIQEFCRLPGNETLKKVIEECNKRLGKNAIETSANVFVCSQDKIDVKFDF